MWTCPGGKDGIRFAENIRAGLVVKDPEKIYIILDSGDPNLNIGPAKNCAYDYVFPHAAVDNPMQVMTDMVMAALAKGQRPTSDDPKVIFYQPEEVEGNQRLVSLMAKDAGLVVLRVATPEALSNTAFLTRQDEMRLPLVREGALIEIAPTEKELMQELMNAMLNAAAGRPLNEDPFARQETEARKRLANEGGQFDVLRKGTEIAALGWLNREEERLNKIVKPDGQEPC